MANQNEPTKRIAAIDLGTNSFHAVIVDIYPDGSFRTIDKLKEMVILAEKGMENHLSRDARNRGIEALRRIKFLCDNQGVEKILAFATSAIREARNGGDFIEEIIQETGIKARAIPGKMEAELIGFAVKHSIVMDEENVLMIDIGGGSVEFIIGNKDEFLYYNSFKVGVARMAAKFISNDPITDTEIESLEKHYEKVLSEIAPILKEHKIKTLVGSSGTMENIAALVAKSNSVSNSLTLNEFTFPASDYLDFYKDFIKLNSKKRSKKKALDEKRIDIINPGLVLVNYLIKTYNFDTIKISEGALRDGMILKYIKDEKERLDLVANFPNPRKRSVHELLRKTNWNEDHSRHVAKMALQLFDIFQKELELDDIDRELLEYSAFLHDIGYYISYKKHHKHALYLIRYSELRGFTEREINMMANIARYHRRSGPKKKHKFYKKLSKLTRKRVKKLSALLRVADGLDRSHFQNVQNLKIENGKKEIVLHIQTIGDPELEIWGANRKADLLEKVTGKKLKIKAEEAVVVT